MTDAWYVVCALCQLRMDLVDSFGTHADAMDMARDRGWIVRPVLGAVCPMCVDKAPTVRQLLQNKLNRLKRNAEETQVDQKKVETKRYTAEEAQRWGCS